MKDRIELRVLSIIDDFESYINTGSDSSFCECLLTDQFLYK